MPSRTSKYCGVEALQRLAQDRRAHLGIHRLLRRVLPKDQVEVEPGLGLTGRERERGRAAAYAGRLHAVCWERADAHGHDHAGHAAARRAISLGLPVGGWRPPFGAAAALDALRGATSALNDRRGCGPRLDWPASGWWGAPKTSRGGASLRKARDASSGGGATRRLLHGGRLRRPREARFFAHATPAKFGVKNVQIRLEGGA